MMISKKQLVIFMVFLVVLIGFAYFDGIANLIHRWGSQDEYSYGYFVPLIVFYLLYQKRTIISSTPLEPNWLGFFVVFVGLMFLLIGELSAIYILIHYSMIVVLLGLTLLIAGKSVFRQFSVPILILITAIPLPYFIDSELSWRLQLLSSKLGVKFIRLFDIPVFLEGNIIDLGYYKLQVVEACSGLSYLFPLMSLGFIVAYIYRGSFWQKVVLFFSTIPITVFMNSFRIGVIGVLVNYGGVEQAEGFLHFFEGWVIFLACLLILWLEVVVFIKLRQDKPSFWDVMDLNEQNSKNFKWSAIQVSISKPLIASILIILSFSIFTNSLSYRDEHYPERKEFSFFPSEIAEWSVDKGNLNKNIRQFLQLDDYYIGDFSKGNNISVNLYMAYYESQRKGASPHSPRVCIPGGGWKIVDIQTKTITTNSGVMLPVNRILIEKNQVRQLVYYWFRQRGRNIANEYWMKWFLLQDAIFKNRTDGALVRLTTASELHGEEADQRIKELINHIYPLLDKYIPQ